MNVAHKVQQAGLIIGALGVIGFIGIVWLLIYGNLSGNLGFDTGTQGFNDTEQVITNLTLGYGTFFGFSDTLFTIAAIVLLISMFVGLLALVVSISQAYGKGRDKRYS